MDKQLFFCFGPPKSGTTFLQKLLNLHPEISCPPEHQFRVLIDGLGKLLDWYDQTIKLADERTGGQGTLPVGSTVCPKVIRYTIESMIFESAGEKIIAGANDNYIITKMGTYNELFKSPKFILIFRNPIDSAISAWHHNMRLAKEENNPQHKFLMTKHGDLEGWIKFVANNFSRYVQAYINFSQRNDNILMLRYEDLKNDKEANIIQLFDFLGASTSDEIISNIIENSSLTAMRTASSNSGFFRIGSTSMGKGIVSDDLRREVSTIASEALQAIGYDLVE